MSKFKILVADDLSPEGLEILERAGEVDVRKGMTEQELRDALPSCDAMIVRSATNVTARALEAADTLTVIGRAGIGVDNIDVEAATERGIVVMNTPEAGAVTTGELSVALMMCLARNIPAADASMKAGKWEKSALLGTELKGQVLGVLGLGRIGSVVADRGRGLQMQVIAHDPYVDQSRVPAGVRLVTFEELLQQSDFLSVHVPKSADTLGLIGAAEIAKMKEGARIINGARGGIVDESALCDALDTGRLGGAALDVFEREPLPDDNRLRHTQRLILTPHLGASTREAKRNVSREMARQFLKCLRTVVVLNGINVPRIAPADAAQVGPFLRLAHNLAAFLTQAFPGDVRSVRLTLQGDLLSASAHPLQVSALAGALQHRADGPVTPVNAENIAQRMGVRWHTESHALKRDFVNLIRVEALLGEERHFVSGTVLGHRHGRMVELDRFMLDAIPEGPMLVTFHEDQPGVVGQIGQILGDEHVNISRVQLGSAENGGDGDVQMGILNLSSPLGARPLKRIQDLPSIRRACAVNG